MSNNITSANATGVLTVAEIFPQGFVLDNFGTDQALSQDNAVVAVSTMGVDGRLSSSFRPSPKVVTLTFSAASDQRANFDQILQTMQANKQTYECTLLFTIPSLGKTYTYTGGVLNEGNEVPNAKAELEQVTYKMTFENMTPQNI